MSPISFSVLFLYTVPFFKNILVVTESRFNFSTALICTGIIYEDQFLGINSSSENDKNVVLLSNMINFEALPRELLFSYRNFILSLELRKSNTYLL